MKTMTNNVKCLNPWDPQSKRQYRIDGVYATLNAGQAIGGQAHGICYAVENQMNALIYDGSFVTSPGNWSNPKFGDPCYSLHTDSRNYVVIALEGNTVDRASNKNGKGLCENVSPTLNTQDRHAICFQLSGDRDNPSVSVSDTAYCIPANPMSDRGQAVCYGQSRDEDHIT